MNSKILILGLHHVGKPPKNATIRGLFISPKLLSFELWLLSKLGYEFSTLRDALCSRDGKKAVITFDDGYEDNFTAALPILDRHNARATIFVVTEDVGQKQIVWDEAGEKLPGDFMSWQMLEELQNRGWEIGSHGHRHVHFESKAEEQQAFLIQTSIDTIEERLGSRPSSFAFPYGTYDEKTKRIVQDAGIRYAVTTVMPTPEDLENRPDLMELKRVPVGGRWFFHFAKVILRTFKAVGTAELLSSLVPASVAATVAALVPERGSMSILSPANEDVVPR